MRFSLDELHFIFSEIRRVLKPKGFNFFSVRNQNDKSYSTGVETDKGIYDINGFQVRFFTEKEIQDLAEGFGASGTIVAGHLGVVRGYLVYTFFVVNTQDQTRHPIMVDAGNAKVLYASQV